MATRQYALLKCKNDITMRILETQEERKVKALREKDAMKQERDIALKEAAAANKERDIVMREVTDTVIQQKKFETEKNDAFHRMQLYRKNRQLRGDSSARSVSIATRHSLYLFHVAIQYARHARKSMGKNDHAQLAEGSLLLAVSFTCRKEGGVSSLLAMSTLFHQTKCIPACPIAV